MTHLQWAMTLLLIVGVVLVVLDATIGDHLRKARWERWMEEEREWNRARRDDR